jgi:hypothetical protein
MDKALQTGQESQTQADAWAVERAGMTDRIRELNHKKRWLDHQIQKHGIYIQKQEESIAELKRQKEKAEHIRMELEPFLDDLLVRLEKFVAGDLPFLREERQRRLQFLRDSLNDHRLSLDEKTGRVFQALQIEAGYGGNIEQTGETVEVNGSRIQANVLRLGRTALLYQTPDGKQTGRFNRETGTWGTLDPSYGQAVRHAIEISEKRRTPDLLTLPVGRPAP